MKNLNTVNLCEKEKDEWEGKEKNIYCVLMLMVLQNIWPPARLFHTAATPEIIGPPDNPRNAYIINSITVFRVRILSLSDPDPQHFAWIILPDST